MFAQFNEDGFPTADKDGNPITKSASKNYQKALKNQTKLWKDLQSKGEGYASEVQQKFNDAKAELVNAEAELDSFGCPAESN